MELKTGAIVRVDVSKKKTWMGHFQTGFTGILGRNSFQKYGGSDNEWTVFHPKRGGISWYNSDDLTVIAEATPESELKARRLEDRGK
ncbi:hypothetical protein NKJ09_22895 [Mesorhizobium sp. M0189]|uniref:hypothetical protein n=1 Tax=Mesorhizobium sp. M0189 TaxID=2956909 RepID=UPI00333A3FFD